MDMKKMNLQLFAEGAAASEGAQTASGENNNSAAAAQDGRDASEKVVYGKQNPDDTGVQKEGEGKTPSGNDNEPAKATFDELIKGEYKEDFQKKMQQVINKRFAETKRINEQLERTKPILDMISDRYGLQADDIDGLINALENDESYYEQEAISRGMDINQLKQIKRMEMENKRLREQVERSHQREESDRIYRGWMEESEQMKAIYPDFDFRTEVQNEDFASLLKNGIDVKTAYEVVHKDEIITGAMAMTAQRVREKVADDIRSNGNRAVEGGTGNPGITVKSDVNKLTKKDREEIERRVMRGEKISF